VPTRHTDLEAADDDAGALERRVRQESDTTEVGEPDVGVRCKAIGHDPGAGRPRHLRQRP